MLWFYAQYLVFIAVDAGLFLVVVLRLLSPPTQAGASERQTRMSLVFLSLALAFLGLRHLVNIATHLIASNVGGQVWGMVNSLSAILAILLYIGFGVLMAAAIAQLLKPAPAEGTAEPLSNLNTAPTAASGRQPTRQHIDWGYLWKQLRLGFFRCIGLGLLIAAAPLAFVQRNPGVGVMALATAFGCLWLGFHRKSPLKIKYARLADEEAL